MNVRRILVPLDGSRLAEAALPAAGSVAARLGASLVLLHVLELRPPRAVHGEPHLAQAGDALAYLEAHAERLRASGVAVTVDVHERPVRDVAAAIDQHTHEHDADLIAMCAHGRTNLRERHLGSIAERILRGGSIPILLRTIREVGPDDFALHNVLVPIDFGHDVDAALAAARTFASAYGAAVTLLSVPEPAEPASARLLPSATALARQLDRDDVARQVEAIATALRADLPDVRTVVDDGRPADAILAAAESLPAELIVVVTDAHGGLAAWVDPSTGRQLLGRPDLTLLLIKEL